MVATLDLPVELIEPNVFLTRYSEPIDIADLAQSIQSQGQLEAIGVRPHPAKKERYQIIYGHRRLAAIKKLGWKTIRAEVKNVNDKSMLQMALVENLQRQDISDFEKGMLFQNLSEYFDLTYDEIGEMVGKSKQFVSNHIGMTRICSKSDLDNDADLIPCLQKTSESHARVLARVADQEERINLLKLSVKEHLCARELRALVGRPRDHPEVDSESLEPINKKLRSGMATESKPNLRQSKVCLLRTESLNFLISQLKITPHEAGVQIAKGAGQILRSKGIDPLLPKNWSKVLIEKSKHAGWGKMSTTTDSKLVVHEPSLNSEFLRGYLETLLGVRLECKISNSRIQLFEMYPSEFQTNVGISR